MGKKINIQMFEPPKQSREDLDTVRAAYDEFLDYLIDLSKKYPDIAYIMSINGIPCFPRGDIQAIKGKAKQGKTHVLLIFMVALLLGEFLGIRSMIKKPKICYFATEEHERSVAKLVKKVHRLCHWNKENNNERFLAYSIRRANSDKRREIIEKITSREKPDVIFIDGIRDLVTDFNNTKEASAIMDSLMRLASEQDCAIICVLHTNKSRLDNNMRGHLGTELENKSSDVLEVEKNKDEIIFVQQTECRNIPTGKWGFTLDCEGLPQKTDDEFMKTKTEKRVGDMKGTFTYILLGGKELSFSELKAIYRKRTYYKEDTANKHIIEMTKNGFLTKTETGKYKLSKEPTV